MEGAADVCKVLKEVQMVFFYIKYNADFRKEAQKAVCVLARFRDKEFGRAHSDIAADRLVNAADGQGWVCSRV